MGFLPDAPSVVRVPVTIIRRGKRLGRLELSFADSIANGTMFVLSDEAIRYKTNSGTRIRPGRYRLIDKRPYHEPSRRGDAIRWFAERVMD